ncbi:hypothetical protein mRhiFer1_008566 [Rhinolophus ferrumequinum]|uniref:Uncharacterized protein n=1 Tax=Rhinolophus ferrumequinum TaxID=59479 RepID=A0A7J7UJH3_RHIFE|nr:hypothetical protein mRhiFer1_008566 [Rhinolophus ferrumequinum]
MRGLPDRRISDPVTLGKTSEPVFLCQSPTGLVGTEGGLHLPSGLLSCSKPVSPVVLGEFLPIWERKAASREIWSLPPAFRTASGTGDPTYHSGGVSEYSCLNLPLLHIPQGSDAASRLPMKTKPSPKYMY